MVSAFIFNFMKKDLADRIVIRYLLVRVNPVSIVAKMNVKFVAIDIRNLSNREWG